MKFWAAEEAINYVQMPSEVAGLVDVTLEIISIMGGERTRLLRIGQNDGGREDERFQVDLELAPGVVLPTTLGFIEGIGNGCDDSGKDEDSLSHLLEEGLATCLPILDELADALHDARLRARQVLAEWNAAGIPTRLMDVRLAQYDYWRGIREPALLVTVETLMTLYSPSVSTSSLNAVGG